MNNAANPHLVKTRKYQGFTLVETTVVIVVLAIIGMTIATIINRMAVAYYDTTVQSQLHMEASSTLDRISRELRTISSVQAGGGGGGIMVPDIQTANTDTIIWNNTKTINYSGDKIYINVDGVNSDILATSVSGFSCDYFDEDNSSLLAGSSVTAGSLEDIRRISVQIDLTRGGVTEILHTKLYIRSTMSGS